MSKVERETLAIVLYEGWARWYGETHGVVVPDWTMVDNPTRNAWRHKAEEVTK